MRRVAGVCAAALLVASCSHPRRDRADVANPPTVLGDQIEAPSTVASTTTTTIPRPSLDGLAIALTKVGEFDDPTVLAFRPGDEHLYVGERAGKIRRLLPDGTTEVVLDITSLVKAGGEQGLLAFAFAPRGSHAYVHYSNTEGDTAVDEFTVDGNGMIDSASRRHVLGQQQPYANHNGGQIEFGADGYLYIGLGDGGSSNDPERRADKHNSLLGKILRIDPRPAGSAPYGVPADNPFVNEPDARPEIFHLGLRNPWRFSFDTTGALWIGDVGQNLIEEVDVVPTGAKGINFGWSAFEGSKRFNEDITVDAARVAPIHEYEHGEGSGKGCSVTGGYRYRGTAIGGLIGAYVFGDYCTPGIRAIDPANPAASVSLNDELKEVSTFGQGPTGELYVATLGTPGAVYRLDPKTT
jgi:glucose/arabinose dehydrogenase